MVVKAANVHPKDSEVPPCGVDDMTKLAYLHEPGVLHNLKLRYDINEIYVSTERKLSVLGYCFPTFREGRIEESILMCLIGCVIFHYIRDIYYFV